MIISADANRHITKEFTVKKTILFISLVGLLSAISVLATATAKSVPCAEIAKQVEAIMKANKL